MVGITYFRIVNQQRDEQKNKCPYAAGSTKVLVLVDGKVTTRLQSAPEILFTHSEKRILRCRVIYIIVVPWGRL